MNTTTNSTSAVTEPWLLSNSEATVEAIKASSEWNNSTEEAVTDSGIKHILDRSNLVPVVGQGSLVFYSIHGTALASLGVSIIASLGVLIFMKKVRSNTTPGHQPTKLCKLPVGERLVVYLSVGDLLFSTTHALDHGLMLALADNPPDSACVVLAFFMLSLYYSPSIVALFTAFNAFWMIVRQRHIELGRHDWRLLVSAFIFPAIFMAIFASLGFLGASGIACSFYYGSPGGRMLGQIFSVSMVTLFILNASFYTLVFFKIRQAKIHQLSSTGPSKYARSARIMLLFVVAYFIQNWSVIVYYTWSFFTFPPLAMVYLVVTFVNMGGVFNAIAYTVLRRRYLMINAYSSTTPTVETPQ